MTVHNPIEAPTAATVLAALGTDPIPAAPYYDHAYFVREMKAVFGKVWLNIGHVCEIAEPGRYIRRELEFAKASVLIWRGKDGTLRAFHNACTHRGTQLTEEPCGKANSLSCPYHRWSFASDGSLLSAPDFERFYTGKADLGLKEVAVDVCAGLIFINLDPTPEQSLAAYLGDLAPMLETLPVARATCFSEYTYEIAANWKLTYDNFQENYHLRFIHTRSVGPGVGADNPFGYPAAFALHGEHRTQTIWSNPDAANMMTEGQMLAFPLAMARSAQDGILDSPHVRDYFALFPNFFLLGSPSQHFLHTVFPLTADRSRGVIRLYWVGDDQTASVRFAREFAMATVRDVHSEDRGVIERGQRGLSSGALEHIHFQEQEVLCRHLYHAVDARVKTYQEQ